MSVDTTTRRAIFLEPLRSDVDISTLDRYEKETLFSASEPPSVFDISSYQDKLLQRLNEIDYDPERDAFVISGRLTKIAIALASVCLEYGNIDNVKVLMYDGHIEQYVERTL